MEKRILSEINRVLELMSVNKKVITEAAGPGPIFQKLFGSAAEYIMSKLGRGEGEAFEKALSKAIGDTGFTIENIGSKELQQIIQRTEFQAVRKIIAEAYVASEKEAIAAVVSKYDLSIALEAKKAYAELVNVLGVNKAFVRDTLTAYKELGGSFAKAGEEGAETGVKAGVEDAEKLAAQKAEQEAEQKSIAEFQQSLNLVKQTIDESFPKINENEAVRQQITTEVTQKIKGLPISKQLELMTEELIKSEAQLDTLIQKAEQANDREALKKLSKVKSALSILKKLAKKMGMIKLDKDGTPIMGAKSVLRLVVAMWFYETIIGGIITYLVTDKGFTLSLANAATFNQWNAIAVGIEKFLTKKYGNNSGNTTGNTQTNTTTTTTPVAGAIYANNLDDFMKFCQANGIDGTKAKSVEGGGYKSSEEAGIVFTFKQLDPTTKLGTFE